MFKLVSNQAAPRRWRGHLDRLNLAAQRALLRLAATFLELFPPTSGHPPSTPNPPLANSAALREGARLTENVMLSGRRF